MIVFLIPITNLSFVYRSEFRKGLVEGDKHVVYPILEWLLRNAAGLKKRAYLARYLVKVEVPGEFMAEEQIGDLHQQVSTVLMVDFILWCPRPHNLISILSWGLLYTNSSICLCTVECCPQNP